METLPLETLQKIFELSCTDGGSTGNALSLTSKGIRAAARHVRFHSLHLAADAASFPRFVTLYTRECGKENGDRPRVRHLFLILGKSDSRHLVTSPQSRQRNAIHADTASTIRRYNDRFPPRSLSLDAHRDAVQSLTRLVASDLWSLTVLLRPLGLESCQPLFVLENPFPLVREATFLGVCDPECLLPTGAKPLPVFPAATHLHIAPELNEYQLGLPAWSAIAPRVTHLRVSNIWYSAQAQELADAVGVHIVLSFFRSVATEPPLAPFPRTYPTVRQIVMEPCPQPRDDFVNSILMYRMTTHGLRQINERCLAPDVDVTAVFVPQSANIKSVDRDRQHLRRWLERVEGGNGWWAE
ncbi:hypothetical protein BC628DRAFT_1395975 [Trametes gibbosa]|nr:hypothetical protein BC628DRAFT_1395975 [Trametes gibbosa]